MAMATYFAAIIGLAFLLLSIPAFIGQDAEHSNFTLPYCLLSLALLWMSAAAAAKRTATALNVGLPDAGASLLILGGLALVIELVIRLLSAPSFGGNVASFNFGLKCTVGANASACTRNEAFTPEFNSFGHCVQGTLSVLLLPVVERAAAKVGAANIVRLASCVVAVYPIYNIIKRAAQGASGFAASSFANNGAEWAMGFVLGLSVGIAGQAVLVAMRRAPNNDPLCSDASGSPDDNEAPTSAARQTVACTGRLDATARMLRLAAGTALCSVSVLAGVLLGLSWDNTVERPDREDGEDVLILIVNLAVPVVLAALWLACCWQQRRQQLRQQGGQQGGPASAGSRNDRI